MTNENIIDNQIKTSIKPRQTGLELLRIIAIFLITCVHMLNYGGFLSHATSGEEHLLLRLLYSFFTVSVNIFVLISGYFMAKSKFKLSKLIKLWGVVVFYCVSLYIISIFAYGHEFTFKELIDCFMPVLNNKYWFFTAYIFMYLISPLLNKILNNSSKKEFKWIIIGIFVMSYISNRFLADSIIVLKSGYNLLWFICLYLIGGIIRLGKTNIKKWVSLLIFGISILLICANFYYDNTMFGYAYLYNSPTYTAPLVLLASIALFYFFKDFNIKNKFFSKLICIISSTTFGVYLLQEGNYIKKHIYFDIIKVQNYYGRIYSILYIFLFVTAIFVAGFIYDMVRQLMVKLIKLIHRKINKRKQLKNCEDNITQ